MKLVFRGALEADCLPDGAYAVAQKSGAIDTHLGSVQGPPGYMLRYVRITTVGGFKMAGVAEGKAPADRHEAVWEWADNDWHDRGVGHGTSPAIYDLSGDLHIARFAGEGTPSQGYRYVDAQTGRIVRGDETYTSAALRLAEYSVAGPFTVGQGFSGGVEALYEGGRYAIEPGETVAVRASFDAGMVAVATRKLREGETVVQWLSIPEATAQPVIEAPPVVVPPVVEPPPVVVPPVVVIPKPPTGGIVERGIDASGTVYDPQEWVMSQIEHEDPRDWERVITRLKDRFYSKGIGFMNGAGGNFRGRIYLPNTSCPFPAPQQGDSAEVWTLGVKRDPPCWDQEIQLIDGPKNEKGELIAVDRWAWIPFRQKSPYQAVQFSAPTQPIPQPPLPNPEVPSGVPTPTPSQIDDLKAFIVHVVDTKLESLRGDFNATQRELANVNAQLDAGFSVDTPKLPLIGVVHADIKAKPITRAS